MALSIRSNISSLRSQRTLADASDRLSASTARLASGLRINSAADDAAGLAIASQLNLSSRLYAQGIRNINDGISVLNVAEGALSELRSINVRQKELAEQAANGVYSSTQRKELDREANALVSEYNRIVASTTFNGLSLFDGDSSTGMRLQAGLGVDESISISFGSSMISEVGDGTFSSQRTFALAGAGRPMNGDVNGDGKEDLVVLSSGNARVFIGNGDGTFNAAVSYTGGTTNANIFLHDIDNNNTLDLILPDNNAVQVLLGNGDGTFRARRSYAGPSSATGLAVGDFNKDGQADLLVGDSNVVGNSIFLLIGNGDGSFKSQITFSVGGQGASVVQSDFNSDGNLDFYVVSSSNDRLHVFLGNGDGSFKTAGTYDGAGTASPVFVDVNGDGIGDHVAADGNETNIVVLFGNSDGSFQRANIFSSGPRPRNLSARDVNGDGAVDVVTTNSDNSTASVLINNGDGTFKAPTTYANALRVRIADFNGDGVQDIATTNSGTNTVGMYFGNTRPTPYVSDLDLSTQDSARSALTTLDVQHRKLLLEVGNIGSAQQRLAAALKNLTIARENFMAAESRIREVDVGQESATYVREQILQQASAAIAAQSIRAPEVALSLLT